MRASFNWLKDYVDIRISPEALAEKLTMAGLEVTSLTRIDEDTTFEIEVTPNRTDCLSILGIAREVAAITGKRLKTTKMISPRGLSKLSLPIQIQERELCWRYLGRVIKNVRVDSSPEWLIRRLEAMGVRAVNNIVDITNFCLLEFGQPLHAFDLDRLQGQRIIVRCAREEEAIVTIDGLSRRLQPDMLVIADRFSPQAIAGIMGAKISEVIESTKSILLESAYFQPLSIHRTSRKLGLATESSYRFERGVDLEGVYWASIRATELIRKLARPVRKRFSNGARPEKRKSKIVIGRAIDKGTKTTQPNRVHLRFVKLNQSLGVEISPVQIKEILRRLELKIVRKSKKSFTVSVPSFRPDISREADLIEEVARLYGYDKIPLNLSQLTPNLSYAGKLELVSEATYENVRRVLASLGFHEIMTYSLISRQALRKLGLPDDERIIAVKNPLSYEQEILRPNLVVGMLNTIVTNINHKNVNLKLFELSRIYIRHVPLDSKHLTGQDSSSTEELTNLCIGMAGKKTDNWLQNASQFTFFDLKGAVEAILHKLGVKDFSSKEETFPIFIPGRCACISVGEENLGFLGELKKDILRKFDIACPVYLAELKLFKLLTYIHPEKKFVPLAKFPSIERDISLIVSGEIRSEQIASLIKRIGRDLVAKVTLFDQYFGEQIPSGCRGLAYSIEYRSQERTLKTEEVDRLHNRIRQALSEELKAQLR